jgi:hypothetical protein
LSEILAIASGFLVVCKEGGKLLVPYMGYIDDQLKALTHLCVLYFRFWLIS